MDTATMTFAALAEAIRARLPDVRGRCLVVGVDGMSGAGKSSFARQLATELSAAFLNTDELVPGWDGLAASLDVVVERVLVPLALGEPGRWQRYDWVEGRPAEWVEVPLCDILVLEGCCVGTPHVADHLSYLVWIETPEDERRRRLRGRNDWEEYAAFFDRWAAQETALQAGSGTMARADLVVDNSEAQRRRQAAWGDRLAYVSRPSKERARGPRQSRPGGVSPPTSPEHEPGGRKRPVSLLPPLVGAGQLYDALGDQHLRLFDATVFLRRAVQGGPYTVESGASGYEESHIPTAAFADIPGELSDPASPFPFTVPDAERFAAAIGRLGVGDDSHVVAYAQESPMWATRLWWLLRYFGHDDVSVLDGGLVAWKAFGGALERGARHYEEASFTPRTQPGRLATLDEVKAVAEGAPFHLVNALPAGAFRGEGPCAYSRPGRIPSSVNVPWSDLVDPDTNRFRAPDRLSAAFADSGVEEAEPVIAYCGGGISATVDLFALELTGRSDGRLYDGSLTEWSADRGLQLVTG